MSAQASTANALGPHSLQDPSLAPHSLTHAFDCERITRATLRPCISHRFLPPMHVTALTTPSQDDLD